MGALIYHYHGLTRVKPHACVLDHSVKIEFREAKMELLNSKNGGHCWEVKPSHWLFSPQEMNSGFTVDGNNIDDLGLHLCSYDASLRQFAPVLL